MYSQANVRAGKVLRPPVRALPSVMVVTEKVMREADGPVGRAALTAHFGWNGVRPRVRLESRSGEPGDEPEEHERYVVRVETDRTASDIQARSFMARTLERIGKKC